MRIRIKKKIKDKKPLISDSHKSIDVPPKDKMIRLKKTK